MTERYNEVYEEEYRESRQWASDEVARDRSKVAACLDALARRGLLKVQRYVSDSGWVRHRVYVLNEDGEDVAECGGRVEVYELRRSGESWPVEKERLTDGRLRIELMITDRLPDIEMFRRKDGSRMDLGFNDNEHYYSFSVVMDEKDLEDQ
jgi:hypothetical protein